MKKILYVLLLIFSVSVFAQNSANEDIEYIKIAQKKCIKRKGYQMVLKEVISDSRCPENVTCIWAGDVKMVISIYQNRKFLKEETVIISPVHNQENMDLFSSYLPSNHKNIKSIAVFPYPKNGNTLRSKDYYIKIGYEK